MPRICMFYGIIISMYYLDTGKHKQPHFHARYGGEEASIAIKTGKVLGGSLPPGKMKLVQAWLEIHKEELQADWDLVVDGNAPFMIEPLK